MACRTNRASGVAYIVFAAIGAIAVTGASEVRAQGSSAGNPAATAGPVAPNDYARAESWLCRPGRQDACTVDLTTTSIATDGKRTTEPWTASNSPAIDCFYVYPTVSLDTTVASDMVPGPEERDVIRLQFARFASVCRPFAPMYRQVTLRGLRTALAPGANATLSLSSGTGYRDVVDAWNHYLAHDNGGRGVVLIGHSQGAMVLTALLRAEIEGRPVQNRVVSALLLGTTIAVPKERDRGGDFASVPLCHSADQVGCVISYASFRSTVPPSPTALFARVRQEGMIAACTNPAALAGGAGMLRSHLATNGHLIANNSRAAAWDRSGSAITTPFVTLPGLVTAACVQNERGSYLEITVHPDSSDPRADDVPGDLGPVGRPSADWGLHLVDVDLAIGNLVDIVGAQGRAYVRARGAGGAAPPPALPAASAIPRTVSGKPDLNGIWQAMTTAYWDLEPHPARAAPAMRPGPVVPVPARELVSLGAVISVPAGLGVVVGGTIPYTPEGLATKRENQANWLARDPEIRCYLPGVPRAMYMPFPFQIFQSEKAFFIAHEYAGATRNIYLTDPGPPQVDTWMGQSVGRWDGDTFVVESSGFNDQSWLDRAGNHHSEGMKVVERFTMTTPFHIAYQATIDDARTFTRPWSIRLVLYRNVEPGARLGQFKCTEFVEELLYGHLRKTPVKP